MKWKLSECMYLGDKASESGAYVAAVSTGTRCGWVRYMDFGICYFVGQSSHLN